MRVRVCPLEDTTQPERTEGASWKTSWPTSSPFASDTHRLPDTTDAGRTVTDTNAMAEYLVFVPGP
jgi:hypothetical protein